MMADVLLSARGIGIRFGGVVAADNVDLDVLDGESLAIIGPNGAGKTTFLNIATGYLRPQAGVVTFLGKDITAQPPRTITRLGIARAFQIPQLFLDQTVIENLLIAAASRARRWTPLTAISRHAGARGDGAAARSRRGEGVRRAAGARASGGPAQARRHRDGARLEAEAPPDGRADVGCRIVGKTRHHGHAHRGADAEKVTSVFVEHDMEMVERYASRVAVWSSGKIQKLGPPAEVLKDPVVREQVIGI